MKTPVAKSKSAVKRIARQGGLDPERQRPLIEDARLDAREPIHLGSVFEATAEIVSVVARPGYKGIAQIVDRDAGTVEIRWYAPGELDGDPARYDRGALAGSPLRSVHAIAEISPLEYLPEDRAADGRRAREKQLAADNAGRGARPITPDDAIVSTDRAYDDGSTHVETAIGTHSSHVLPTGGPRRHAVEVQLPAPTWDPRR